MKKILICLLLLFPLFSNAQFDKYFLNKTLRIDYFRTGNDTLEYVSIDELIEEQFWGGSKINLLDTFNYGNYKFEVYDISTGKLIYSRGYCTLFNEWKTTEEAKTTWKTFSETVVFPFPKNKVTIKFFSRTKNNNWNLMFTYNVAPNNYFISKEPKLKCNSFQVINSGDPAQKLDIVIIPDGYTKSEMEKFKKDCKRFAGYILNTSPFSDNKDKVNIWAVEAISEESGTDIPNKNIWKQTILNTSFCTFDSERYLTTPDNKTVRSVAANVPYDQIFILVNTDIYGGGGIFNFYSVASSNNKNSDFLMIHEFGHAFAGLADEYYSSDVSVQDYHPLNIEPWEPNITTLVDFDSKWKSLISAKTPIPTPVTKEYYKTVGVYEGAGYIEKGVYRPFVDCTMKSAKYNNFCPVCRLSIQKMLDFYSK